jgi:predicted dehydrogenase
MLVNQLRVGLVGAGPWASKLLAPTLASSPEVVFSGVWARRPESAGELAHAHGTVPMRSYEHLLASCDAVVFCVPPAIQAELAVLAAAAGKHLLLDKPLGLSVSDAEAVAAAVSASGVRAQVFFTNRYTEAGRRFVTQARGMQLSGLSLTWVNGAARPGQPFATPGGRSTACCST